MLGSGVEGHAITRPGSHEPVATELPRDICCEDPLGIGSAIVPGNGQVGQLSRGDGTGREDVVRHATSTADAHGTPGLIGGHLQRVADRGQVEVVLIRVRQ